MKAHVYRMFNDAGELLYVGCSANIANRLRNYATDRRLRWIDEVTRIDVEHHGSITAATEAESAAIRGESPRYNVTHNPARPARIEHRPEPNPARRALGRRISDARLAAGMSRVALAKACGVTTGCVSHWENGRYIPTLTMQETVADVLNVEHATLFGAAVALVRAS